MTKSIQSFPLLPAVAPATGTAAYVNLELEEDTDPPQHIEDFEASDGHHAERRWFDGGAYRPAP